MTRLQHLEFCKQRAREYLDQGDVVSAITSMMSDLKDHAETRISLNRDLVAAFLMAAANKNVPLARRLIEGFR